MQKIRGFNPHRSHMSIREVSKLENYGLILNHIKVASEIIETARIAEEDGIAVNMQEDFKDALRRLNEVAYELRVERGGSDLEIDAIVPGKRQVLVSPEDLKEMGFNDD